MDEAKTERASLSTPGDFTASNEHRAPRYDPIKIQAELFRREHIVLAIGGVLPLLLAIVNYIAFNGRIFQNVWAVGVIVSAVLGLLTYLFAMSVRGDLTKLCPDFNYKNIAAQVARLNELSQERAWMLFFLLHKVGKVGAFFTSLMLSSCLVFLFKSFID